MNKKGKKLLTLCLTLAMVLTMTVFSSAAFAAKRYDGADRYDTAIKIVEAGWEKADTAVVTIGGNPADALSAAPLAKSYDAPLLLVEKGAADTKYNAPVIKKLKDLGVKNVIIVGGTNAVTKSVEDEIAKFATVKRVSGADRYATSVKVAEALAEKTGKAPVEIAVANGADASYPDSLSISSIAAYKGMPILLTQKNALPKVVADYVKGLELTKSYVVGGTAVVSDNVAKALKESTRLSGANRYATNRAVLGAFDDVKYDKVYIATGNNFADALAGSALAAKTNSPIVLVDKKVDADTKKFVDEKVTGKSEVFVLGGEKAVSEAVIEDLFGGALRMSSVEATGAKKIEAKFNKPVDTSKATIEVKKGSVVTNIEKTDWSEDKKAVALTTNIKLTKGEYTVNITVGDDKFSGKFAVEDEKIVKIELTSDKLALSKDDMTEAKVGYVVYNQYKEDISDRASSITWNVSPGTIKAQNGVITVTNTAKFMLDQKAVITALDASGVFMSSTVTVSRKPYIKEIVIGDLKSTDDKIKTINTANIAKFYFPVTLKDQYGNVIKDAAFANKQTELLAIKVNIDGEFKVVDDSLRFELKAANPQYAMKAVLTFVSANSGDRATKEFEINATAVVKNFTMEFPETIAVGDKDVEIPYTAIDQFGSEVKDITTLKAVLTNLNAAVSGRGVSFKFTEDVRAKKVRLYLDASSATKGKVLIIFLTPGNDVYNGSFDIVDGRDYKVVSGVTDLAANYVEGAKGTISSKNILLADQYGKTTTLFNAPSSVEVEVKSNVGGAVVVNGTLKGSDAATLIVDANKEGTSTLTAEIKGKADSVKSFKLNAVNEDKIATFEVEDIAMLNGHTAATRNIVVVGKLADGSKVVLKDSLISNVKVTSDIAVLSENNKKINAVKNEDQTKADTSVALVVVIDATNGGVITKNVKISYKASVPAKVEVDGDKVEDGLLILDADKAEVELGKNFIVTDQYGDAMANPETILTVVKTNVVKKGGNPVSYNVLGVTQNGFSASYKVEIQ